MQQQKLEFNNKKSLFELRLNAFSAENTTKRNGFDMERIDNIMNIKFGSTKSQLANLLSNGNYPSAPDSLDYRNMSLVTNVGDQGE